MPDTDFILVNHIQAGVKVSTLLASGVRKKP